jgi:hypothetical protein
MTMADAIKFAAVTTAGHDVIEAMTASYYVTDPREAARHEFRALDRFKRMAEAFGYRLEPISSPASLEAAE